MRAVYLAAHERTATGSDGQPALPPDLDAARIGTTLDSARTARELADAAVPQLADFAVVDLLDPLPRGDDPSSGAVEGVVTVRRTAVRSVLGTSPQSGVAVGDTTVYPALSPPSSA